MSGTCELAPNESTTVTESHSSVSTTHRLEVSDGAYALQMTLAPELNHLVERSVLLPDMVFVARKTERSSDITSTQ